MSKKPKTTLQKIKGYLSDRKYQLTNMHEDVVEDLDETKGPGYVWVSIEIITDLLRKIEQFEKEQ